MWMDAAAWSLQSDPRVTSLDCHKQVSGLAWAHQFDSSPNGGQGRCARGQLLWCFIAASQSLQDPLRLLVAFCDQIPGLAFLLVPNFLPHCHGALCLQTTIGLFLAARAQAGFTQRTSVSPLTFNTQQSCIAHRVNTRHQCATESCS